MKSGVYRYRRFVGSAIDRWSVDKRAGRETCAMDGSVAFPNGAPDSASR